MLSVFLEETRISLRSLDFLLALAMRESNHTHYFLVSQPTNGARSRDQGAFCMARYTYFVDKILQKRASSDVMICITTLAR